MIRKCLRPVACFLKLIAGKELKKTTVEIKDKQLILDESKKVEIRIFRNDEPETKKTERFQIEILMPWGNLYAVTKCPTRKEAEKKYKELVERLETNRAAIVFGKQISVRFFD